MKPVPKILILNNIIEEAFQLQEMLINEGYTDVVIANNCEDALAVVKSPGIDLILIKISNVGEWDAIKYARNIQALKYTPIIYLSDFLDVETIAKARKTHPSAFIGKPFLADQISIAIEAALCVQANFESPTQPENDDAHLIKVLSRKQPIITNHNAIYVKENYKFVKILLGDILYLQANNNYTFMATKDRSHTIRKSLQYLVDKINCKQFVRVHRSYIVNTLHIVSFDETTLLISKKEIPISKNYRDTFFENFTML